MFAWAMYDFANSAFATLVLTFIYGTFFVKAIAGDVISGTHIWSRGVTLSALIVALLSPPLGALADAGGYRKRFLLASTALCIAATGFLYFPVRGQIALAIGLFVTANVAFEMGVVFHNAFLPGLAPPDRIGRISGYGWSLGYVGGLIAMGLAMVGLVHPDTPWFGIGRDGGEHIRATNLLVAAWFAVFSLPIFLWVKEKRGALRVDQGLLSGSYRKIVDTLREVKRYRQTFRLLLARLVYNDGLVAIFAFAGIYAAGTFGFSFKEIMVLGIVLNVSAGIGAFAMGFPDDYLGGKRTIQISLYALILISLMALLAPNRTVFWIAGILLGIFVGPNQSASRSLMGRFVPAEKENEFFGFFAFSGKATAFLSPLLVGELTRMSGSHRVGMSVVVVFFSVGSAILRRVDEEAGISAARGTGSEGDTG